MKFEHKKQHIIEASAAVLLQRGARKTSMEEIAQFTGVSKVTIYKYYTDRSGLFGSVCEWLTGRCIDLLREQLDAQANPAAHMAGFTAVFSDFISSGQRTLCMELSRTESHAASVYEGFERTVKDMLYSLIREGKRANIIDPALEDEIIYHYIDMGFCYFQNSKSYRERMRTDDTFKTAFMQLVWRSIFTDKGLFDIEGIS